MPPSVNAGRTIAGSGTPCSLVDRDDDAALGDRQARRLHRGPERQPVLGPADRLDARAEQLDAVPLEHAGLVQLDRDVERGLTAERGQQRVRPLALDHLARAVSASSGSM